MERGEKIGERTSDGFANEGMAEVGIGGSVYTMKSACIPAAAARRRKPDFTNILMKLTSGRVSMKVLYATISKEAKGAYTITTSGGKRRMLMFKSQAIADRHKPSPKTLASCQAGCGSTFSLISSQRPRSH
jgi:hypothetical protein